MLDELLAGSGSRNHRCTFSASPTRWSYPADTTRSRTGRGVATGTVIAVRPPGGDPPDLPQRRPGMRPEESLLPGKDGRGRLRRSAKKKPIYQTLSSTSHPLSKLTILPTTSPKRWCVTCALISRTTSHSPPVRATSHRERLHDPVPLPTGSRAMAQSVLSTNLQVGTVRQEIERGGSTLTTSQVRLHRHGPERLRPRNRAPGAAEVAPPSQATRVHSWLHSPVRVTSATTRHTASIGTSTLTSTRPERVRRRWVLMSEGGASR